VKTGKELNIDKKF